MSDRGLSRAAGSAASVTVRFAPWLVLVAVLLAPVVLSRAAGAQTDAVPGNRLGGDTPVLLELVRLDTSRGDASARDDAGRATAVSAQSVLVVEARLEALVEDHWVPVEGGIVDAVLVGQGSGVIDVVTDASGMARFTLPARQPGRTALAIFPYQGDGSHLRHPLSVYAN